MSFFRKLFGGGKRETEPMRGVEPVHSSDEQSATRSRMEAEVAHDRAGRLGTEPAEQAPGSAAGEREPAVIALVTKACGDHNLQTTVVDVQKLEGGTVSTLRFTLDDSASTDLERERVIEGTESVDDLATIVVVELRRQSGEPA